MPAVNAFLVDVMGWTSACPLYFLMTTSRTLFLLDIILIFLCLISGPRLLRARPTEEHEREPPLIMAIYVGRATIGCADCANKDKKGINGARWRWLRSEYSVTASRSLLHSGNWTSFVLLRHLSGRLICYGVGTGLGVAGRGLDARIYVKGAHTRFAFRTKHAGVAR